MTTLVRKLLAMSITLMINAAVIKSFLVFWMRFGLWISGMTATPVSKPDNPSASFGNLMIEKPSMTISPCVPHGLVVFQTAACQLLSSVGCENAS